MTFIWIKEITQRQKQPVQILEEYTKEFVMLEDMSYWRLYFLGRPFR